MKNFTNTDHTRLLRAAQDARATQGERDFLAKMASMAAASEPVDNDEYLLASTLAAISMRAEDSTFDRPKNEG